MKHLKTFICLVLALPVCVFAGCGEDDKNSEQHYLVATVTGFDDFNGAVLNITSQDMTTAGFHYGDVCSIATENGKRYDKIPYYNGYYAPLGDYQMCAYPGEEFVVFTISGAGLKPTDNISIGDKLKIVLVSPGEAMDVQQTMGMEYTDVRQNYPNLNDDEYANARECTGGRLAKGILHRSASPFDNKHNRADYASDYAKRAGINFVIDLADDDAKMSSLMPAMPAFSRQLVADGKVMLSKVKPNYTDDKFINTLISSFREMIRREGPYLVHCVEGKDRTGYMCALLEGLCGASWDEIKRDYMITYYNYFGVTETNNKKAYNVFLDVRLKPMVLFYSGFSSDKRDIDYDIRDHMRKFLISKGMTAEELDKLEQKLIQR